MGFPNNLGCAGELDLRGRLESPTNLHMDQGRLAAGIHDDGNDDYDDDDDDDGDGDHDDGDNGDGKNDDGLTIIFMTRLLDPRKI